MEDCTDRTRTLRTIDVTATLDIAYHESIANETDKQLLERCTHTQGMADYQCVMLDTLDELMAEDFAPIEVTESDFLTGFDSLPMRYEVTAENEDLNTVVRYTLRLRIWDQTRRRWLVGSGPEKHVELREVTEQRPFTGKLRDLERLDLEQH